MQFCTLTIWNTYKDKTEPRLISFRSPWIRPISAWTIPKTLKEVFRTTVEIARHFNLIGGKLIAGDSTKLRAQNSKKNNFNKAKTERHIAYIDNKLEEYTRALAEHDGDDKEQIEEEIKRQNHRKGQYKDIERQLKASGEAQISASDPESRQIVVRNNITEVNLLNITKGTEDRYRKRNYSTKKVLLALFSGLLGHIRGKISCFNRFISGNLQIRYMKTDLIVMD